MKKIANNEQIAHTSSDMDLLRSIINDENYYVAYYMTDNPNKLDRDILDDLSDNPIDFIRGNLISRPDLPKDLVEKLSRDDEPHVRSRVAHNTTDRTILISFLNDKSEDVKLSALQNSNMPKTILEKIIAQKDEQELKAIARNYGATPKMLEDIFNIANGGMSEDSQHILELLAMNPNTSPETLSQLIDLYDEEINERIAERDDLTDEHYGQLLAEYSRVIYKTLIGSLYTPKKIILKILNSTNETDLIELIATKSIYPDVLKSIYTIAKKLDSKKKYNDLLIELAKNASTPKDIIKDIVISLPIRPGKLSDEYLIKQIISRNPNADNEIQELLLKPEKEYSTSRAQEETVSRLNYGVPIKPKTNQDLELLHRLKGYLE